MRCDDRARLGSTAVSVTRLGFGGGPLGNLYCALDDGEARNAVDAAYDAGVRFFDVAPLYGHGLAETRLGAALASRPRDDLVVATKVGRVLVPDEPGAPPPPTIFADIPAVHPVFDYSADGVLRSVEASLTRLGLDRVDVLHVHDPDDHAEEALATAFPTLVRLRDEGVVGAIGAGMNQSALLTRFVREVDLDCVLLAGRYSLLDQRGLDDLLPLCAQRGVSVIAAGVFNSGLLADPAPGAPYDYVPASDDLVARARALQSVCASHGVPLKAAALRFPFGHPAVTAVLVGTRTADEARENAALFETDIPADLWADLRAVGLLGETVPVPSA